MFRANCIPKASLFCSTPFMNTSLSSFIMRIMPFGIFQKNIRSNFDFGHLNLHKKFQLSRTACYYFCTQKQSQKTQTIQEKQIRQLQIQLRNIRNQKKRQKYNQYLSELQALQKLMIIYRKCPNFFNQKIQTLKKILDIQTKYNKTDKVEFQIKRIKIYQELCLSYQKKRLVNEYIQWRQTQLHYIISKKGEFSQAVAMFYCQLSFYCVMNQKLKKALEYSKKSIQIFKRCNSEEKKILNAEQILCRAYVQMDYYNEAEQLLQKLFNLIQQKYPYEISQMIAYFCTLNILQFKQKKNDQAIKTVQNAQELFPLLQQINARTLQNMADLYYRVGKYYENDKQKQKSEKTYQKYLEIINNNKNIINTKNLSEIVRIYKKIIRSAEIQKDYKKQFQLNQQLIKLLIDQNLTNDGKLSSAYITQGYVLRKLQGSNKGIQSSQKALQNLKKDVNFKDKLSLQASVHLTLALDYNFLKINQKQSREFLMKAKAFYELLIQGNFQFKKNLTLTYMGLAQVSSKDKSLLSQTLQYCNKSQTLLKELEINKVDNIFLRNQYVKLFDVFFQIQKKEQAIRIGEKALVFYDKDQDKQGEINTKFYLLYQLGRYYFLQKKFEQAKKFLIYFDQSQQKRQTYIKSKFKMHAYSMIAEIYQKQSDEQNFLKFINKYEVLQLLEKKKNQENQQSASPQQIEKKEEK